MGDNIPRTFYSHYFSFKVNVCFFFFKSKWKYSNGNIVLSSSILLINITAGSYVCYPSNTSVGQWHAKQKVEDSPQLKPLCLLLALKEAVWSTNYP